MNPNTKVNRISNVLLYLDNHKYEIVEELFEKASAGYKEEWYNRDPARFWFHLDLGNQARVVEMAEEYYA